MSTKGYKILVVDDDEEDRLLLKDYILEGLASKTSVIDCVGEFDEAITALKRQRYDVLLIDYRLGTHSGLELIDHVKAVGAHSSMVLLTGLGDEELAVTAMKKGVRDYLNKNRLSAELIRTTIVNAITLSEAYYLRSLAEDALKRSEANYRELVTLLPVIVVELSVNGIPTLVNDYIKGIIGYDKEEFILSKDWQEILPVCTDGTFEDFKDRLLSGDIKNEQLCVKAKDGRIKTLSLNARGRHNLNNVNQPELSSIICIYNDITEGVELRERLHTQSIMDELTGLYNRRGFYTLAAQQIRLANRYERSMLLFFLDMDGMKTINDSYGHKAGDRALVEVANIMRDTFRESDVIGRTGGDEFIVLVPDMDIIDENAIRVRLQENIDAFNDTSDAPFDLSISVGVVRYSYKNPMELDELIAKADSLMYAEKSKKKAAR
ncbi:response regulator [Candidatus Magnetobacterium bavaricum]|uniref:diguanylate cyclase n=1 Tax=Candidatus Magnetobacterium bavaricum TaxID=29290 RepID=A0A0F3GYT0_9BACT|nr:response regulator [Candidatus Magnetobacterium bavaricum]